jgi:deoxyribonuclease V
MIACIDSHYSDLGSRTGLVLFANWEDSVPVRELVHEKQEVPAAYVPGSFFRRELPCTLEAIQSFIDVVNTIVIDGYVWLNESGRKGLGARLYEALDSSIPVIGVAKSRFSPSTGIEVYRGASRRPLIITAVGLDAREAACHIQNMHGKFRIPTLIRRADYLARHLEVRAGGEEKLPSAQPQRPGSAEAKRSTMHNY